jgi:hypothetical protein
VRWTRFREQGVIDLLGVTSYCAFLATVMNATRTTFRGAGNGTIRIEMR